MPPDVPARSTKRLVCAYVKQIQDFCRTESPKTELNLSLIVKRKYDDNLAGKVDIQNSNKIHMTNVKAFIYLKDSQPIKIISKYAIYNKITHIKITAN